MSAQHSGTRHLPLSSLATRARQGDRDAFEQLVVATSRSVYSLAFRLTGNEHDAKDVTQDAFIRAFRSIGQFRGDSSVTTWLYRITANCAASHLRKKMGDSFDEGAETQVIEARREFLPEEMADRADSRRLLVAALSELSREQRMVIVLHDIYDLTHDAIASELHITRATSKIRLHRARRHLREALVDSPLASMRQRERAVSSGGATKSTRFVAKREELDVRAG